MIKEVSAIFAKLKLNYDKVVSSIATFVKRVDKAIMSQSINDYNTIMQSLHECETNTIAEASTILEFTANGYQYFADLDARVPALLQLFKNKAYIDYRNSAISFNTIQLEEVERNATIELYTAAKRSCIAYDSVIFSIVEVSFSKTDLNNDATLTLFLTKHREINRFTIYLMGRAINTKSRANLALLRGFIEENKDNVIAARRSNADIKYILSRYNLRPISAYIAPPSLDKIIKGIIEAKQVNLVVITKESANPLEYNLAGILDEKYIVANNLKARDGEGLNAQFIRKMSTIAPLCADANTTNAISTTIYDLQQARWLIMEVMCDKYRILCNNSAKSAVKHMFDYAIPVPEIAGLISGLSGRPSAYGNLCSDNIEYIDKGAKHIIADFARREELNYSTEPVKAALLSGISKLADKSPQLSIDELSEVFKAALPYEKRGNASANREIYLLYYTRLYHITGEFAKLYNKAINTDTDADVSAAITKTLDQLDALKMFTNFGISIKEVFLR